jgi:hypothetical protein
MKQYLQWISALLVGLTVSRATGQESGATAEAICGYGGRFVAAGVGKPTPNGLAVELLAGEMFAGQTVPLRFRVYQSPGDAVVDDLQVEHEKRMHVIGVRDDLGDFFHIHPQRSAPGMWQAIHTFTNGGRYQVWTDIKRRGTVYSFAQTPLVVTGRLRPGAPPVVPALTDVKSGYQISLQGADELRAGRTNLLRVIVRNSDGAPVGLDFFLGALMHLVLVRDDLDVYLHGHAENHDKSQRVVSFRQVFPAPGNYKLFAQFRPAKTKLPPDEAILAEFWVTVAKAD